MTSNDMSGKATTPGRRSLIRFRWAAIGAAAAVAFGAVGAVTLSAAGSSQPTALVPITPCRLLDTRPGDDNVGARATPFGPNETFAVAVHGTNGECTIPATATGVSMNVTVLNGTAGSFLTVFPADVAVPRASSLNWGPGQPPTPNAVTSPLSAGGMLGIFNLAGTVDVIADVVGYYQPLPTTPTTTTQGPVTTTTLAPVTTTTLAPVTTTTLAPVTTTTLPAFRFESSFLVGSVNKSFAIDGFEQVGGASVRTHGWLAPRACTMTGSVAIVGGVTNPTPSLGITLRFTRWNATATTFVNGGIVTVTSATASGSRLTLPSLSVGAGELVTLEELFQSGSTVQANTQGYLSAQCA